ncbi:MAG TPA: hypothetical protein DCS93_11155 [Microscillaceae bacterium]|nr:hypothetical protein [Microscillaceae bacterium]
MMNFDLIKPEFLKRADQYLLTHYPMIWQTRIIWVAFYSLSLFTLAYLFGDYFDHEPGEILYPDLDVGYNHYLVDRQDRLAFGQIPLFLSALAVFYWLYIQYQHKIDYSKLNVAGFLGVIALNFACIVLILLPAVGLAFSAFDITRLLNEVLRDVQITLTLGLSAAVLPFIIREFSLIEIVLVVFAGFVYCFLIAIGLRLLLGINFNSGVTGALFLNFWVFVAIISVRFYQKTYTQQTKRLALLCLLSFTLAFPYALYLLDVYPNVNRAYREIAHRHHIFTLKWLAANIFVVLSMYGMFVYFMYRSLLFPIKRK